LWIGCEQFTLPAVVLEALGDVVLMSCELRIFIGDESERMLEKYDINAQSVAVDAIQSAIHIAAINFEPWAWGGCSD